MAFTPAALRFFKGLSKNNNKVWFENHRADYENEVREPMRALIVEVNAHLAKFAPEIAGDPKRGMFRINRDIRFSKDKSPYKTNAGCWFNHRSASSKVGSEANEGSAGFYFHLQPGKSFVGAGLWMPPRPQLDKLREAIADDPRGFDRMAKGLKKYGGLSEEHGMLKRMPRGYADDHPAGEYLRLQSYTCGRSIKDSQLTEATLPAIIAREFRGMLPLVRWLNTPLGYRAGD
jgi:uncharacterized protein (TIGR02453 family)